MQGLPVSSLTEAEPTTPVQSESCLISSVSISIPWDICSHAFPSAEALHVGEVLQVREEILEIY